MGDEDAPALIAITMIWIDAIFVALLDDATGADYCFSLIWRG
jgi:hypothetical protein